MPLVTTIRVQHIRIHASYSVDILPSTTVITGVNGSGKTSLIEALYIALQGTSFKGADNDVLQTGAPWYRIDIHFDDGSVRTVKFDPQRVSGKKQFIINETTQYRMLPRHKHPVVLFEPDDLRLLNGSPSRRREYIDRLITQLDPQYGQALRKYDRALKQRNNLLKQATVSPDELFVWDMVLSEHGAYIIARRDYFIKMIDQQLNEVYNKIADSVDVVSIKYPHGSITKQKLLSELHSASYRDMLVGFTSVGPHRHDVVFTYNSSPALAIASRGEVRSIMLALKFIEVDILERVLSTKPIILLDDVFSELDASRQEHLVHNFKDNQVIITSATSEDTAHKVHIDKR